MSAEETLFRLEIQRQAQADDRAGRRPFARERALADPIVQTFVVRFDCQLLAVEDLRPIPETGKFTFREL
jgi:hypothetical protein